MKIRSILFAALALTLAATFNVPFAAMAVEEMAKADVMTQAKPADAAAMSTGEVKKIDKEAGKITIKHGPLANLDMPGMTMVFRVKDPAMLDQVKPGDKINFIAEKVNAALTVTKIEKGA
ncbi:MAG: copper-binding protein [Collimonas sp.]